MPKKTVILGAGRFGVQLATRLHQLGRDVVLCDSDPKLVQDLADRGYRAVRLDADEAGDLKAAGVGDVEVVVVAIGENMQASILATMTLKEMGVPRVIARATSDKHAEILRRLGADQVISPDRDAAWRLAEELDAHTTERRFPFHGEYQLARVRLGNKLADKTLGDAELEVRHHVTPVLIVRQSPGTEVQEELLPAPGEDLLPGDFLFVVGHKEAINTFEEKFGYKPD